MLWYDINYYQIWHVFIHGLDGKNVNFHTYIGVIVEVMPPIRVRGEKHYRYILRVNGEELILLTGCRKLLFPGDRIKAQGFIKPYFYNPKIKCIYSPGKIEIIGSITDSAGISRRPLRIGVFNLRRLLHVSSMDPEIFRLALKTDMRASMIVEELERNPDKSKLVIDLAGVMLLYSIIYRDLDAAMETANTLKMLQQTPLKAKEKIKVRTYFSLLRPLISYEGFLPFLMSQEKREKIKISDPKPKYSYEQLAAMGIEMETLLAEMVQKETSTLYLVECMDDSMSYDIISSIAFQAGIKMATLPISMIIKSSSEAIRKLSRMLKPGMAVFIPHAQLLCPSSILRVNLPKQYHRLFEKARESSIKSLLKLKDEVRGVKIFLSAPSRVYIADKIVKKAKIVLSREKPAYLL